MTKANQFFRLLCLLFAFTMAQAKADDGLFFITKYGAKGDGKTLNTKAIQKALDAAEKAGGGTVIVSPGVYVSGTIFMKNNVTLEVQAGATIVGSSKLEDYTAMTWGHNIDRQPYHLIMAKDVNNFTIQGGGTIDGNGKAFWKDYDPKNDPQWILAKDKKISPMVEIQNCKDVRIKDITLTTGGGWTLHLYDSDHVQVQGAKILNNLFSPNGDGIDISGCFDVTVSDCIIKTCDDAICLKTTGDSRECRRVVVTNCVIECSCAALKIGNESFRDISQVTFSNCVIYNSSRAIGLYAESAGTIEDVAISNIVCDTKAPFIYNRPIHISLFKRIEKDGSVYNSTIVNSNKVYSDEGRQPRMRNISISNFVAKTEGRILITAEPGRMIENLTMRDITLTYPMIEDPVPNVSRAKSWQFSPMNPDAKVAKAAVVAENVKNFVLDNLVITWPETKETPKDWAHPQRIANGTLDKFTPDYTKARQTEFSAVWGRNMQGGYIYAPLAAPSDATMQKYDFKNSTILFRK